jgi:hypothetical protein
MRSKYRSVGGGGLGFFAFQDIITGTAGFLIVIAVLLALDINIPKGPSSVKDPTPANRQKLDSILAEIARLKSRLEKLQTVAVDAPETLRRQIAELKDAITAIVSAQLKKNSLPNPADVQDRSLLIETQKHLTVAQETETSLAQIKRKADEAASEIVTLEKSLKDAEEMLKQAISNENIIKLIPDDTVHAKKPVVILVDENNYEIHILGGGPAQQASSTPDLRTKLAPMPPSTHFLVLYYKPSSAGGFNSLNQEMRGLGYEIGYDLVTESTKLEF